MLKKVGYTVLSILILAVMFVGAYLTVSIFNRPEYPKAQFAIGLLFEAVALLLIFRVFQGEMRKTIWQCIRVTFLLSLSVFFINCVLAWVSPMDMKYAMNQVMFTALILIIPQLYVAEGVLRESIFPD